MDAHLIDSAIYGHLWSTQQSRAIFSERARLARWLDVLKALAKAQADLDIIPRVSAMAIAALDPEVIDAAQVGAETRKTSHSTLGLIRALQAELPAPAREHIYYGATVQDITDSALTLEIAAAGDQVWRDLHAIEAHQLKLAADHRDTAMLGRTHGQPGAPVTFGFKAATWADETARHIERWHQSRDRLVVGQLAGAVGVLGFYSSHGISLRRRFCEHLGIGEPAISWLTSRDRLAEFATSAALTAASLARMANEVYNLQRREIGEVSEAGSQATVGSITMPHKRNPERSEQIVTLARMVRSAAGMLTETMVGDHERDGRTWKTEWVLLPELCHYLLTQLQLARDLAAGVEVHPEAMRANLLAMGDFGSQELLRRLSARIGKHRANDELQDAYRQSRLTGRSLRESLAGVPGVVAADLARDLEDLERPATGSAAAMVDDVLARAAERRASEPDGWL